MIFTFHASNSQLHPAPTEGGGGERESGLWLRRMSVIALNWGISLLKHYHSKRWINMVQKMPTFMKTNTRLGTERSCPHFSGNASLKYTFHSWLGAYWKEDAEMLIIRCIVYLVTSLLSDDTGWLGLYPCWL